MDAAVEQVRTTLAGAPSDGGALRATKGCLSELNAALEARFRAGEDVAHLVRARAAAVDELLLFAWRRIDVPARRAAALVAVGGYGRGELHPYSDIDVTVLVDERPEHAEWLSDFLTTLWDSGLEIGHSVRTLQDCRVEAEADVTVVTTLMESRLLDGDAERYAAMCAAISANDIWDSKAFFRAKCDEQRRRHARYDDSAYNLEPNVKGSPGGLRDIQMVGWVAHRHFGSSELSELVDHGFLTPGQLKILLDGRRYLWRIRFGLHCLTGRAENRLLFDLQKQLAELLGYEDARYTLAVEQMMQRYYRTVRELSRVNEMLLQLFEEAILMDPETPAVPLNARFKIRNGYLQTTDDDVFTRDPSALLEVFALLQEHGDVRGISAWTIGLLRRSLHLIDDEFRNSPKHHRLFLKIIGAKSGVTHELRRMNRYGVLGLYIPAFGRIVGRMQFDLFHAYTVDEHTLFVVSNMRKLALPEFDHELPQVSAVMQQLEKPELAYLSALFHDIAKGRGGDHSKLGAVDAEAFCLEHGLNEDEANLVAWLVRHHLLLSMTAQKKDLGDPEVIQKFARVVGTQTRLDHLYVLTVADVRGTNPRLWNAWKASLFSELYRLTSNALQRGLDDPADSSEMIESTRRYAVSASAAQGVTQTAREHVWAVFTDEYFLRYRAEEIAWHTRILDAKGLDSPCFDIDTDSQSVAIFLYTPRRYRTFAHTTAMLDDLGIDVQDARIVATSNDFSLDTYMVSEAARDLLPDIEKRLTRLVAAARNPDADWQPTVSRRRSRRARAFTTALDIRFAGIDDVGRTVMELDGPDRPGLLSTVGETFAETDVDISMAKIVTIGEKAEDVFYLTGLDDRPLTDEQIRQLRERLLERLGT
ncbi:MAG: [protein-PII] uridylyltransferase [Pseudomonadota bacterium]